jgi:hypothetical protein
MKNFSNHFDTKINYQKYSHYLLPIAIDPLKYGKLIEQFENKYIIQLNTSNVLVIKKVDDDNLIRLYRKGDFMLEFTDSVISEKIFTRIIFDQKFTFENNKLISTEILNRYESIKIYPLDNSELYKNTDDLLINKPAYLRDDDYIFVLSFLFKIIKDPLIAFLIWEICLFLFFYVVIIILPEIFINNDLFSLSTTNIIKLRRISSKNVWKTLNLSFYNRIFTKTLFERKVNTFWSKIEDSFTESNHMFLLFRVKYINGEIVTIGVLQRLNFTDKDWFIEWIITNMEFKSEYYKENQIESLIFSYGFKEGKINKNKKSIFKNTEINKINIINSINPSDFGTIIDTIKNEKLSIFFLQNEEGQSISIRQINECNLVKISKKGKTLIEFKDIKLNEIEFIREVGENKYFYKNNELILSSRNIKSKFIKKINKDQKLINNFLTLDIETYKTIDGILTPFCISFFDGKNVSNFWLTDYSSSEELVLSALSSLLKRKYNNWNVYMHNMAKFDIIFLFKYLVEIAELYPVIHNNRIISIVANYGENKKYKINFRDSFLILLNSLSGLCKSFKVDSPKIQFPILFLNEENLNYEGLVPDKSFFKNITNENWESYRNSFMNNWNLRKEAIKYCNLDCISLYQVLIKFNELIFKLFNLNIHHYPTLPSLAFAIFRSNFMKEENIPQLSGKISDDIRSGYTGGSVDVFIPESKPGKNIYCYDVNSLYPYQMQSKDLPVGQPSRFNGDILKINPDAFGFFYCKVIAPDNIKHPILQTHVNTGNGIRTISPIGTWEDMLFSEEMINAQRFGYKFDILWGYTFERCNVFKDYVDFLYNLRLEYDKSNPLNFIAKILLNSLYGRFGMDDKFTDVKVIHKNYSEDYINKYFDYLESIEDLGDHF